MMGEPPCFVVGLPPLIEATDGDIVTLQVRVTGNPEPSVTWYHCGDTVRDVAGKRDLFRHDDGWYEFVVTNTNEEDEGEYECKAENVYGCASTFGDLYYYSREYSDSTKEGSEADYTRADDNDEFNGRQSGLLILIDDGSQTDDDSQDRSLRRSLTASEQMQGIIEDLTQDDGSVTLGRDDFGSDRDLIDPADQMLIESWHHTNAHYQRNHGGHTVSDSTWDSVRRPGNRRASGTCRSPAAESGRSGPVSEPATSWYPQLSTTNESFGDLSSDNVSSLSTPDPESTFTCVTPFSDLTNVSAAAVEATKTENASVKSKKSIKFWDIAEEDEDHVKPRRITPDGLRNSKAQSPGSEDTSAKMSSFSKSSIKSSSYVGEESVSKTSIRSSRLDSTDLSSSALSSVRRSTAITSSFDADDDLSSSFRRSSRTSALDDDIFGGAGTRRSLRSRLDDDTDSGIASIRRTSGLGSRDDDLESTLSSARRLTSRLSSKDEDESSSPAAFRASSRTSSKDEEDGMLVKRSTKMSSSREEDDRYSLSKTKFSSSIDAEDENSSLSVRTKKSSMSYKEEDTSGSSVVKSSRSALSYSESFSSETKSGSSSGQKVYEAIIDFEPVRSDKEAIPLKEGQRVEILDDASKPRKWFVRTFPFKDMAGGVEGWVPSCYLEKVRTKALTSTTVTEVEEKEYTDPKELEASTRRAAVVKELVETEEDFSRDMQYVVRNYVRAMDDPSVSTDLKNYKEELFGNFKAISEFHNNELIKGVQYYANEPSKLGITFLRLERDFDKHVSYCKNEPHAQEILETTALKSFFEEHTKKIKDDKTLAEHLKLPIQRINDYQLLLKELIKYSSRLNEDTTDLQKALELMQTIPQKASDAQFLNSIQGYKGNLHKFGRMLCHDWFEVTEGSTGVTRERYVFLFKGRMCVTDVKKVQDKDVYTMKNIVKLNDVKVSEPIGEDKTLIIEHVSSDEPGFPLKLKARTSIQKESWVKELTVTAITSELADLGEDEPVVIETVKEPTLDKPNDPVITEVIESERTIRREESLFENASEVQEISEVQRLVKSPEPKVEILEDFEAYEEMNTRTQITESIRSGSITSMEDFYSAFEDDAASIYSTASEMDVGAPKPKFRKSLRSVTCQQGETVTMDCEVISQPPAIVSWLKDNKPIKSGGRVETVNNGNYHSLIIRESEVEDSALYTVVASDERGTVSCSANLNVKQPRGLDVPKVDSRPATPGGTVLPHEPVFKVMLKDTELLENTSVRFELVVRGHPEPKITFYKDDEELKQDDRVRVHFESKEVFELILDHVVESDAGRYKCKAVNSEGQAITEGNIAVTKHKILFQGILDEDEEVQKTPSPVPPAFKWFRDGKEFEASERFEVNFDEQEDTLALCFHHVKPDDAGLYTCVASTCSGKIACSAELTVQGLVNQLLREPEAPGISANLSDVEVSEGASAMLEVKVTGYPKPDLSWFHDESEITAGGRYKFLFEDNESTTLVIKNVVKSDTGKYKVVAKNDVGEVESVGKLTVTCPPVFKKQLKDTAVMTDEPIKMEVAVEGKPEPEIKWYKDGQPLSHGKQVKLEHPSEEIFSLTIAKAKPEDAGSYSCVVTNPYGSQTGFSAVTVNAPPSFLRGMKNVEAVEEESISLSVKVAGTPKPTVSWSKNGSTIKETERIKIVEEETNTYLLTIEKVTKEDAGKYECQIKNDFGKDSSTGNVGIKSKPTFSKKLTDMEFKEGDVDITMEVKVEGLPKPNIKWLREGKEISETKNIKIVSNEETGTYSLRVKEIQVVDAGQYTVEASNSVGKSSSSGNVSVNAAAKILEPLKDVNTTVGQDAKFTIKFKGTPKPEVKWSKAGASLTIDGTRVKVTEEASDQLTLIIRKVTEDDKSEYSVEVSNMFGKDSSSAKLNLEEQIETPRFTKNLSDQKAKIGEDLELSVYVEGKPEPKIRWLRDDKEIQADEKHIITTDQETGTHTLKVKNLGDNCGGKYTCEASNKAGLADTSSRVTVQSSPEFVKGLEDQTVSEGQNVVFKVKIAGAPKPKVTWINADAEIKIDGEKVIASEEAENEFTLILNSVTVVDTGKYSCKITNEYGEEISSCKLSVETKGSKPSFEKGLEDQTVSEGQNVSFKVKIAGTPKPKVTWMNADAEIKIDGEKVIASEEAENEFTLVLNRVTVVDTGKFSCKITNEYGEEISSCKLSVETKGSKPSFEKGLEDQKVSEGQNVSFKVKIAGTPKPKVTWMNADAEIKIDGEKVIASEEAENEFTLVLNRVTVVDTGKYSCKITNEYGEEISSCKLSVETKGSKPSFEKGLEDQTVSEGQNVSFKVKIAGTPKPKVTWMNADAEIKIDGEKVIASEEAENEFTLVLNRVAVVDTGNYSCKITNEYGEEISSCKLSVESEGSKPSFKKGLNDLEAREGDTNIELSVEVEASPAAQVTWTLNGTDLSQEETVKITEDIETGTHVLVIKKADSAHTGSIKATASNEHGSADSSASFTVLSKPKIEKGLNDVEVNEGESCTLTVKVTGEPKPEVAWSRDGEEVATSATVTIRQEIEKEHLYEIDIDNATIELAGDYECKATNELGEALTKGKLTVNSKPKFIKGLKDQEVWAGEESLFEVQVTGSPEPEITWFKEETKITETERIKITSEGTMSKVTITDTKMEDSATYKCKATNKAGSANSEALLSVQSADESAAPTFVRKMVDTLVIVGDAARFEVKVAGTPAPTITWYKNEQAVTADSTTILGSDASDHVYTLTMKELTVEDSGSFSCKAVNDKGEATCKADLTVKEPVAPEIDGMSDKEVKIGTVAKFEVKTTGLPSPTVSWLKDGAEIKSSDSVVITKDQEKGIYSLAVKSVKEENVGSYVCKATNSAGTCEKKAKLSVKGESPSFLKDLKDATAKIGDDISFEVRVGGYPLPTLTWLLGDKEISTSSGIKITQKDDCFTLNIKGITAKDFGTYTCKAKNASGEAKSTAALRTKDSSPVVEKGLQPSVSVDEGGHLILEAKVNGQPMPEVKWLKDGKPLKPDNNVKMSLSPDGVARLEVLNATPADAGKYEMVAKNDQGEVKSPSQVTVQPSTEEIIEKVKPKFVKPLEATDIVEGKPTRLEVKAVGTPAPQVAWLKNGEPIDGNNRLKLRTEPDGTSALIIDSPTPEDAGKYTCIATNEAGDATTAAPVAIKRPPSQKPEFSDGLKPTNMAEGKPCRLEAKVSGEPKPEVKWTKDGKELSPDNHVTLLQEPDGTIALMLDKVTPEDAGKYAVIVSNPAGEAKSEAPVTVTPKVDKPRFDQPLLPALLTEGEPGKLEAKLSPGVKNPTVTWLKDNKPIIPSDHLKPEILPDGTLILNIDKAKPEDAGKYAVVVANEGGEGKSEAKVTTVPKTLPPAGKKPEFDKGLSPNKDLTEGEPLKLEAKVSGDPKPEIKWIKDGEDIVPSNRIYTKEGPDGKVELTIDHALPEDSGKYAVVATNDEGKTRSPCAVQVKPVPKTKPEIEIGLEKKALTAGQPGKLTAKLVGNPKPAIKWLKDGKEIIPDGRVKIREEPDGSSTLFIDSVLPDDAGKYTVVAANENGETRSSAPITVNQPPIFTKPLSAADAIEGYPSKLEALLTGEPAPEIKWMKDGKNFKPDGIHVKAFQTPEGNVGLIFDRCIPQDNANYCCVASNPHGEASTDADLGVTAASDLPSASPTAPTIVSPLNDLEVKEGEPIVLEAGIAGIPLPAIEWLLDGQPIFPSDNIHQTFDGKKAGLEVRKSNPQHAGKYEVKATNANGTTSSKGNVKVLERTPPRFIQRLVDLEAPSSEPLKLQCRVKGFPEPELEWTFNGSPIYPGLKYNMSKEGDLCILALPHPRAKDSGIYECKAKNPVGEDTCRAEAKISDKGEKGQPPMFLKKLGDCDTLEGGQAKFTACIVGSPAPDIKWFRNGEQLDLSPRHKFELEPNGLLRLYIRDVQAEDFGEYRLSISNPYGSDTCTGKLRPESDKLPEKPIGDQYAGYDKFKKTGAPVPLPDKPRIARMSDDNLTLAWKPSVPIYPRLPVTYQVEHMRHPNGDWSPYKSGIRDSVCDVRGLEPFQDYRYRIRVQNEHGLSDPSPYVTAHRSKLVPPSPGDYKPKDYEIEHPPLDKNAAAPRFLRKEEESMYGIKGRPVSIEFWVYGYPQPNCSWYFNNTKLETGGKYDFLQDRNGQVIIFITRMTEDDVGTYSCHAVNEHGEARQKINLLLAEQPMFTQRLEETSIMIRRSGRLECRVIGKPYPKVKWFKDWQPLHESSRIKILWEEPDKCSLFLSGSIQKDSGLYSCSATNIAGTASTSAMVTIEENENEYDILTYSRPRVVKPKTKPFGEIYDLGEELGRGTQGVAYHAVERSTGKSYAAKVMTGSGKLKDFMAAEMDIMNQLNHPRLVRLWDSYETKCSTSLVTDLCGGGELLDHILKKGSLTESEVAAYIRQVLEGLDHMHSKNIAHLGLTVGDILLARVHGDNIKIGDFGLAARLHPGRNYVQLYGHPEFVAPELVKKSPASLAADMWSVGVVTYLLLSGISPFLGENDRETLTRVQDGKINFFHDAFAEVSDDARDFISKLLVFDPTGRLDVKAALTHPWLKLAEIPDKCDSLNNIDRLKDYYKKWKDWYANASCRNFYRRRTMESCFTHPSRMIYPPGEVYTPNESPERELNRSKPKPAAFDDTYQQKINREAIDVRSESLYQNGPDTYLLQLRDTDFPRRVRQYLRVGAARSPSLASNLKEGHWGDSRVAVRERRKFLDVMDEEIDDEKKGLSTRTIPLRLSHEIGTLGYAHEQIESLKQEAWRGKGDREKSIGGSPFFRERIVDVVIRDGQDGVFSCYSIGTPAPSYSWFRNDGILIMSSRIKVKETQSGRCELHLTPGHAYDAGVYKCVARNSHGVAICRARLKIGDVPGKPEAPEVSQCTDTEAYVVWAAPRFSGNCHILCYKLEYKKPDETEWTKVADNIEHEFYIVKELTPSTLYNFRVSARNKFGWGVPSNPSERTTTTASGEGQKIRISKARKFRQDATERAKDNTVTEEEEEEEFSYSQEDNPVEMAITESHSDLYNFTAEITRGRFSMVVKTWLKRGAETLVSKLTLVTNENEDSVKREYETMKSICHKHIVRLIAASTHDNLVVFVMERLSGMDILTYLGSKHQYNEETVAKVITQVLEAMDYLHHRGICYLELQPDNVVLVSQNRLHVKLVDFGSAYFVPKTGAKVDFKGSAEYVAPEVVKKEEVSAASDVWGVAVLTYILLSGVSPFRGESELETADNVSYVRYRFENLHKEVTQESTRFLMHIFKRTPSKRPTVEECLEHKWLLPSEFLLKKREHAVFLAHKLHEFSEQFHAQKQVATQPRLISMFGHSFTRSISLENDTFEEV